MNKKILTIFLAIILICTLCVTIVACGDKDNNDDANPNGEQTDTPSTDTPAPDDGGSSPIEPSPDDGGSSPIEPSPDDGGSSPIEPSPDDGGSSPIAPSPDDGGSSPIEPDEPGNEEISSNLVFELKTDDTYEVVGYTGNPISVVIPSTYNGKAVTSIGDEVFAYCSSLNSVTIGNFVTSIGDDAFSSCSSLSSVNYLGTIEQWCGITFDSPFANPLCNAAKLYLNGELVEDIEIPNTITEIKAHTFFNCDSITSVTIPDLVSSIGHRAFWACLSLTSVTIGNGVTSIGDYAFAYCFSLSSVTIGNSVTSIGSYAFNDCYKLIEVYNLSTVTIEKGSDSNGCVGRYALDVYTSLDTPSKLSTDSNGYIIHTNGEEKTLVGYTGSESELTLPSGITSINQYALFNNAYTITSVVIPDSVTSIGEEAFSDCTSLSSVTIGNSVTSVGSFAFYNCTSLSSVTIGNSVTSIGSYAFDDCYRLVEVYNLSSLTIEKGSDSNGDVGYYALDVYTSLDTPSKLSTDSNGYIIHTNGEEKTLIGYTGSESELTLPSGITSINQYAFYGCTSLSSVTIPDSVTSIGEEAFDLCISLSSVTVPDSVTSIGDYAFRYCYKLVEVYNLSSLTIEKGSFSNGYVGAYALDVYTSLDTPSKLSTDSKGYIIYTNEEEKILVGYTGSEIELTLPSGITSINQGAFANCTSLRSVTIGNSVTSIGERAFANCSSLSSVTIGNSLTSIGDYAFYYCTSLSSVTIGNSVTSIGGEAFLLCLSLSSVNYLGTIEQWCGITFGDYYANPLYYGAKLYLNGELVEEDLVIPSTVTEIKDCAFYNCDSITSVTIPDSVTSIGDCAFYGCTSIKSVTIGNSVTSIGEAAFRYCTSLTKVMVGNSVTSIGRGAFYDCDSITSVTIPDSVTSIGSFAFNSCNSLSSVTIPDSVTSIGDYAFYDCDSLSTVYYNGTAEEWSGIDISRWTNDELTSATRYYYSETEPVEEGYYWHYGDDGVPTPW